MFSKRDLVLIAAGAAAFHTISHVLIAFTATLPLQFFFMSFPITLTQQLNMYAIIVSALITVGLLWWSSKLK